jgi:hypothetical protein
VTEKGPRPSIFTATPRTYVNAKAWAATLEHTRRLAIKRLANSGLDLSANGEEVAAHILETSLGTRLVPELADEMAAMRTAADALEDLADGPFTDPWGAIFNFGIAVAEAGFLLGLVTGSMTTWPVVQAIEPPLVPQKTRARR